MKERISRIVGEDTASRLWMGTFHSVFLRILRTYADRIGFDSKFTIYDSADSRNLIKAIIKGMSPDGIVRDLNESNKGVERGLDENCISRQRSKLLSQMQRTL